MAFRAVVIRQRLIVILALALAWAQGCARRSPDRMTVADETPPLAHESTLSPHAPVESLASQATCKQRIDRALQERRVVGAPEFERARTRILLRAKGEPVLFLATPPITATDRVAKAEAERLTRTHYPFEVAQELIGRFAATPALLRQIVLRDGYLFGSSAELAFVLTETLRAHQVFDAPHVWVQRGSRTLHGGRNQDGRYVWLDGPERGRAVRLLHADRIGTGTDASVPALHVDLRPLLHELHFERMKLRHVTESAIVADLRYGADWLPTLLSVRAPYVELACEDGAPEVLEAVRQWRKQAAKAAGALQALRAAILSQIDEAIPFDEPLTEVGQQDGRLRPAWRSAYFEAQQSFSFGPDRYPVFDALGRPLPPQVCIDFLLDTLERASGTYYAPRGQMPARIVGRLDLFGEYGDRLRSAFQFTEFVQSHPDAFDVLVIPEGERIEFRREHRLHDFLVERADDFRPGDMVIVRGWTPWDPEVMHYHSAFVYEQDPITGFPMLLAGNAGRPSLRTWTTELWRTPRRSIRLRIRLRPGWLQAIVPESAEQAPSPPPLIAGPG